MHPDAATFWKPTAPAKRKPRAFQVTWWQYVNIGGIGRVPRGTFNSRKDAKAYIATQSAGMSASDQRRWKIEAIY